MYNSFKVIIVIAKATELPDLSLNDLSLNADSLAEFC